MNITIEVDVEVEMDTLHYESTGEIIPESLTLPTNEEIIDIVVEYLELHNDLRDDAEEEIIRELEDARLTYYDDLYHERKEEGRL